jgi:C-terminal processing protease CtpA/Prc
VAGTIDGGAAQDAGIREGDVILEIIMYRSTVWPNFRSRFQVPSEGRSRVLIKRNNKTQQLTATLRNLEGQAELVHHRVKHSLEEASVN